MALPMITIQEAPNPFAELINNLANTLLPSMFNVLLNREKLKEWSDTEFTGNKKLTSTLKKYMPDVITDKGIDWNKLQEYASSDDELKSTVASKLLEVRERRQKLKNKSLFGVNQILQSGVADILYEPNLEVKKIEDIISSRQALKKVLGDDDVISTLIDRIPVNPNAVLPILIMQRFMK